MHGASIVLVSANRHISRSVTRALVSVGANVEVVGYDDTTRIPSSGVDLFLIDADADAARVGGALGRLQGGADARPTLVLCRELTPVVAELVLERNVDHIVANHGGVSVSKDIIDEVELIVTCHKLIDGDIFGLEKYLSMPTSQVYTRTLTSSAARASALEAFEDFLSRIDCYRGLKSVLLNVTDELLMNAIFSAPRNDAGAAKYEDWDRTATFDLATEEAVEFKYGCDGRNVVISVADQFGSVNLDSLLGYLGTGLRHQLGKMAPKKQGAGLGLHMVVTSINHLVFNVKMGQRTEVIASFFIRNGLRGYRASGQSLNLFMEP